MYYFLLFILLYFLFVSIILRKSIYLTPIILFLVMAFITIMMGFRYDVGIDYLNYYLKFLYRWDEFESDPSYTVINYVVTKLGLEFYLVTLISIFITHLFIYIYIVRYNFSPPLAILALTIYTASNLFLYANGMRQGIAVSIVLFASIYVYKKKLLPFILLILLASTFHFSAIFMLVLYFIRFRIDFWKYLLLIFISYLLVATGAINLILKEVTVYIPRYDFYAATELLDADKDSILALGVLLKVIISLVLIYFYKGKYNIIIVYYQIGVILNVLSIGTFMIGRLGYYFYIFDMVAIPYIINKLYPGKNINWLFYLVFASYFILLVKMLILTPENGNLIYKWYFNEK